MILPSWRALDGMRPALITLSPSRRACHLVAKEDASIRNITRLQNRTANYEQRTYNLQREFLLKTFKDKNEDFILLTEGQKERKVK